MTTREKAHKLLDELPESEIEPIVEILASRGEDKRSKTAGQSAGEEWGEPEMAPLPESWGRLPSGAPAPNSVAGLDEVRRARDFLISAADGSSGLDLERLRSVRDRAWR